MFKSQFHILFHFGLGPFYTNWQAFSKLITLLFVREHQHYSTNNLFAFDQPTCVAKVIVGTTSSRLSRQTDRPREDGIKTARHAHTSEKKLNKTWITRNGSSKYIYLIADWEQLRNSVIYVLLFIEKIPCQSSCKVYRTSWSKFSSL